MASLKFSSSSFSPDRYSKIGLPRIPGTTERRVRMAVVTLLQCSRCWGAPDVSSHASQRDIAIAAQRVRERVEVIAPVAQLTEHAAADQGPQQAADGVGIRIDRVGQLVDRQRAVRQRIGDAEIGRSGNRLRDPSIRRSFPSSRPVAEPYSGATDRRDGEQYRRSEQSERDGTDGILGENIQYSFRLGMFAADLPQR